jgi:phosphatidylinositol alpha 1,6-mannosyltransferase
MASGVPVVAPASGVPLDLVQPGRAGLLVPPGDGVALAAAVAGLAADAPLRRAYGAAGRAEVEHRTWAAVGDEMIGHYLAVTGSAALSAATSSGPAVVSQTYPVVPHSAEDSTPVQPVSVQ